MNALDGKIAVVTGASRGIGQATARLLAEGGARVAGCARHATGDVVACDVGNAADVDRFVADVLDRLGPPDVLVNNAGIAARGRLDETPIQTWDAVVDANLRGTFLVTRGFLPAMRARRAGRIINVASISGRQGTANLTAYCAAKHGVVGHDPRTGPGSARRGNRRKRRLPGIGRHRDVARGHARCQTRHVAR